MPRKRSTAWMMGVYWICVFPDLYRINTSHMIIHFCENVQSPGFHDLKKMIYIANEMTTGHSSTWFLPP